MLIQLLSSSEAQFLPLSEGNHAENDDSLCNVNNKDGRCYYVRQGVLCSASSVKTS